MSYNIPTLAQLQAAHQARLEAALNQSSPANDKSFLKILSATEAAEDIGLYKFAANRATANLALTAIGSDLDNIGNSYNTPRKTAITAIITATLTANTGVIIPASMGFVADSNGLLYYPQSDITAVLNIATITFSCSESGSNGNLSIGDTLQIASQIAGARTTATVTAIITVGVDAETDVDYRPRVLFAERAVTGGCNAMDNKIWAEAVTGVAMAFCYSGRPVSAGTSYPGDRSVYIKCTSDIQVDGIAPSWLLAEVAAALQYDPNTGLARQVLGLTNSTLWCYSISVQPFYVQISSMVCASGVLAACKAAITAALNTYFLNIRPFVDGVDLAQERNDTITALTVTKAIQDVLVSYGAWASSVGVGLAAGVFFSTYTMGQGQLGKLAAVSYA